MAGRVDPSLSGANVTLCYSRSEAEDPLLLGHIATNSIGEFDRAWTPPSLGNYVIVATWPGSEENEPATSMPVAFAVVFPWANVTIILTLLSVGVVTSIYLLRAAIHERHPRKEIRNKTRQRGDKKPRNKSRFSRP